MVVCGLAQTGSVQYPPWKKQSRHFIALPVDTILKQGSELVYRPSL